ncbi:hypothetical protein ACS0TY_013789 [Phlomoides rotata]
MQLLRQSTWLRNSFWNGGIPAAAVGVWGVCTSVGGELSGMASAASGEAEGVGYTECGDEMDAKVVVNAFYSQDSSSISVFGDIIQACKKVFISYPHCKVGWVNRQANELAYNLARIARDFPGPFVWAELPVVVECHPYTSCTC